MSGTVLYCFRLGEFSEEALEGLGVFHRNLREHLAVEHHILLLEESDER